MGTNRFSTAIIMATVMMLGGCGGGGGGSTSAATATTISGQAALGPLSGATIDVSTLSGQSVASGTAQASTNENTAGSFSVTATSALTDSVYVVTASGGTDIDPTDSGTASSGTTNAGVVHAYATLAELQSGSVILNPLTEIIYQDIALQYPNGVTSLTSAQWTSLLDTEAKKFLSGASSYSDVLAFLPSRDKSKSKVAWSKVLSKLVAGIHEGDGDSDMQDRASVMDADLEPTGILVGSNGNEITRQADDGGDRVTTKMVSNASGQPSFIVQQYCTSDGALVSVQVNRVSNTQSHIDATIRIDRHVLNISGTTTLLNGVAFDTADLKKIVSKLITVSSTSAGDLTISLDKSLVSKISNNDLAFTVDGQAPTPQQLAVSKNDPKVTWHLGGGLNQTPTQVSAQFGTNKEDSAYLLANGTVILQIPAKDYPAVSGLLNYDSGVLRQASDALGISLGDAGVSLLLEDAELGPVECVLDIARGGAFFSDLGQHWVDLYRETHTSSRVMMFGVYGGNGQVMTGRYYRPVICYLDKDSTPEMKNISLTAYQDETINGSSSGTYVVVNKDGSDSDLSFGAFDFKPNYGYVICPPNQVMFDQLGSSGSGSSIELQVHANFGGITNVLADEIYSAPLENVLTSYVRPDFTATPTAGVSDPSAVLKLDASSTELSEGSSGIASYSWYEGDANPLDVPIGGNVISIAPTLLETSSNKTFSILLSKLNVGTNKKVVITLKTVTNSGSAAYKVKEISVAGGAWSDVALDDTGITTWADASSNGFTSAQSAFPGQDADSGRDALAAAGELTKTGGGAAGFDFTKLDSNGNALASTAQSWSCVRDNVTHRIWQVKTPTDAAYTYTWYNTDSATNGGSAGTSDGGACADSTNCDTAKYVAQVNAAGLCGYHDWRLPTPKELQSIADYSVAAANARDTIDANYFPNTVSGTSQNGIYGYWTSTPLAPQSGSYNYPSAWYINFAEGAMGGATDNTPEYVRLVRGP